VAYRVLLGPYEILDLPDGGSVDIHPVSFEMGTMTISPRYPGAPASKEIIALRIHVREGTKSYPPMYYDVTSQTLIAQLMPGLEEQGFENYVYRVTKYGVAPKARFTLARIPRA